MCAFGTWQGIPREEIPWQPTIDASQCTGCKICFNFCSHGVYGWDDTANRSVVQSPFSCVVGCSNCAGQCQSEAISFPPLTVLKDLKNKYRA
jgi:NAD-dependent dihydropyrimidine dehydrogenase PreA subunit